MMVCLVLDWNNPSCQNFWHLYFTLICPLVASLTVFCAPCAPPAQIVSLSRDEQGQGCVNSCLLYLGNSQGRFGCYIWDVAGSESRQPSYFWWELVMLLAFPFFFKCSTNSAGGSWSLASQEKVHRVNNIILSTVQFSTLTSQCWDTWGLWPRESSGKLQYLCVGKMEKPWWNPLVLPTHMAFGEWCLLDQPCST